MIYALILLFAILHGAVEGMVMTRYTDPMVDPEAQDDMDGVRCHRWFPWYHWLCIARYATLAALVASAIFADHLGYVSKMVCITGVIIIGWQLTEMAYNYTRFRRFVTEHENVMGAFNLNGWSVWLLHAGRWIVGAVLIIGGICA